MGDCTVVPQPFQRLQAMMLDHAQLSQILRRAGESKTFAFILFGHRGGALKLEA